MVVNHVAGSPARWLIIAVMTIGITAGSTLSTHAFQAVKDEATPTNQEKKAKPIFKDGQAQVVLEFKKSSDWIRHHLWVETEFDTDGDGKKDRVHVDVTRQKQTDTEGLKVPVIYETSPYYSGIGSTAKNVMWNPRQELGGQPKERTHAKEIKFQSNKTMIAGTLIRRWVPRGFAVVHSESPGTGKSQGVVTVGGENESLAPKAVIDWLNGRAKGFTTIDGNEEVKAFWCTGNVGMTGTSYNGTLPIAAATTGVKGLKAIIPDAPNTSYYHYYRSNGLVRHPGGYMGEDIDVLYEFVASGHPKAREYGHKNSRDAVLMANQDRATGDMNPFWAGRDYVQKLKNVEAAVFLSHGFNDWNVMPSHSVRVYQELKRLGKPCKIHFHQGGHGGPPPRDMMNRWFTRYLYDIENGVENEPKSSVVREYFKKRKLTSYADYPHPESKQVKLAIGGNGNEVGELSTKAHSHEKQTLSDDYSISGIKLGRAEKSDHRLLFVTKKLTKDLHLSGTAKVKIRMACDKPAANLSVWVVSYPMKPSRYTNDRIITRGWADPQNHKSLTETDPLKPGKFYDVEFDLEPDDQIIPAGKQIGLMIFSSDKDFTLYPDPGTKITIDLHETVLELPVVGGKKAFLEATDK